VAFYTTIAVAHHSKKRNIHSMMPTAATANARPPTLPRTAAGDVHGRAQQQQHTRDHRNCPPRLFLKNTDDERQDSKCKHATKPNFRVSNLIEQREQFLFQLGNGFRLAVLELAERLVESKLSGELKWAKHDRQWIEFT
jgi:hypothetical protein